MSASAAKVEQPKAPVAADRSAAPQSSRATTALSDNRPAAAAQRQQQALINNSSRLQQAATRQTLIAHNSRQQAAQRQAIVPAPANNTGLPDGLKAGVEQLSGFSLDDVRVHYNSAQPAQLQAHAYAHGTDIHVAPGQEQHLPHEAWHVVQQKQGRVKPTRQLKGKVRVNDDAGLEKEADIMGGKAETIRNTSNNPEGNRSSRPKLLSPLLPQNIPVQAMGWGAIAGGILGLGIAAWGLHRWMGQAPEPVPAQEPPTINRRMHFVWLGGRVPDERINNIIAWRAAMPDTIFRLWVDDNAQAASAGALARFDEYDVEIVNINQLDDQRVVNARQRLPTVDDDLRVNPPATGALSDIVRLAALQAEGGTYMDSDNRPTPESANLVGGPAPAGFRLGSSNGVMSNDAISAVPGSPFIEQYLTAVSDNLTPERAQIIRGRDDDARAAVMTTTGPQAMAQVPLPDGAPLLNIAARYPDAFPNDEVPNQLTIATLRNLRGYRELMAADDRAAVNAYLARIEMDEFQREQGNAWL